MSHSPLIDRRHLDFVLHDPLGVEQLTRYPRYAEHGRDTFDATVDLAEELGLPLVATHPIQFLERDDFKAQIELALREDDPQRLRHSLAQLHVGVDRLSRLVQQLLSLARNEPGATPRVQMQALDLKAFALEISMEWVPLAIRNDVDLGFEGAEDPVWIDAESDRLRELINNLIDNAVRYSRKGGRVTVVVDRGEGGHGRLSISDDGPAIPVEERGRVFERFHRLLGTSNDGSGLGLAIVSEIATLHGAHITLEEDVDGVGNTFSVLFPARHASLPALA